MKKLMIVGIFMLVMSCGDNGGTQPPTPSPSFTPTPGGTATPTPVPTSTPVPTPVPTPTPEFTCGQLNALLNCAATIPGIGSEVISPVQRPTDPVECSKQVQEYRFRFLPSCSI